MNAHWSEIYRSKSHTHVSWYQKHPTMSIDLIQKTAITRSDRIIDVGAGASTLVDHLLSQGYQHITLLDISAEALQITRDRIGEQEAIEWIVGDITETTLPNHVYDVWHDRAVFHFLTDVKLREKYVEQVRQALKPGGHVIVSTFATDGPTQCSGLDVVQYDALTLHGAFGEGFELVSSTSEAHRTPWRSEQRFIYCHCRLHQP